MIVLPPESLPCAIQGIVPVEAWLPVILWFEGILSSLLRNRHRWTRRRSKLQITWKGIKWQTETWRW